MSRIQPILAKLHASQKDFLGAADSVPARHWSRRPTEDGWSAAEIVAHLGQTERGILGYADRVIRNAPRSVSFLRRVHLPLWLMGFRIVRAKGPVKPDAAMMVGKETMIAELRGVRERTLAFLEETHGRALADYRWRHPFLGHLDFYDWFTFVAMHQVRHAKQMREITKNLPKDVASSQK